MEKKTFDVLAVSLTAVLILTAALLVVLLALTQAILDSRDLRYEVPDENVIQFLTEFISLRSVVEQQATLDKYFSGISHSHDNHLGESQDLINIKNVLFTGSEDAKSFRICSVKKDYLEFMLLDSEGRDLPCRIGLLYLVNNEGKISSYSIFRLLPVSRKDNEWTSWWL